MTSDPALAARARDWLFDKHLPIWRTHGWDARHGGFHERLNQDLKPVELGYKRLLVQCRQLYCYSHACILGHRGDNERAAREGYAFLMRTYRDKRNGGWFFTVTPDGQKLDGRKDFYGHAFVLFALGYYHRATKDVTALTAAEDTLEVIKLKLHDGRAGGFHVAADEAWNILPGPHLQNPHMHLLEGLLSLDEAAPAPIYREGGNKIVDLFLSKFFDGTTLGEYFGADWSPDPQRGHIVEPGHHFEWAWLLERFARRFDRPDAQGVADKLFDFARAHGLDAQYGGVYDEVDRYGRVMNDRKRIWPLTECLKAYAQRPHLKLELIRHARFLFDRYLKEDGRWNEHLDRRLNVVNPAMPGSTGYHLQLGILEAVPALEAA
ncbi:MAG: AGE family epimerase/isomerase [Rhodospirillaceae bacterium]|nr:AGE family epimerase/isomerase [Rhodospirillaceae bacterium]